MPITPFELKQFIRYPKELDPERYAKRQFINVTTGQVISRRAHQEALKGNIRNEEIARIRREAKVLTKGSGKLRAHSSFVNAYKRKTAAILGVKESQVKVRGDSPEAVAFRDNLKKLKAFNAREKKKGIKPHMRTTEQSHELSRILKDIHFKDEEDNSLPGGSYPNPKDTV